MIISHKLGLIFIHIPKNAGTYITSIMYKLDPDIIRVNNEGGGHNKAIELDDYFNKYKHYKKIAVIRNSFSRVVSFYFYIKQTPIHYAYNIVKNMSFDEFIDYNLANQKNPIIDVQYDYLLDVDDNVVVDVLNFENIIVEFKNLLEKMDVDITKIKHDIHGKINAAEHDDYKIYYNDTIIKKVEELCKKDIEYFGHGISF